MKTFYDAFDIISPYEISIDDDINREFTYIVIIGDGSRAHFPELYYSKERTTE